MRHLVSIKALSDEELEILVERAAHFKKVLKSEDSNEIKKNHQLLLGRTIALLFSKRSTRTRISTEGAAAFFGAQPMFLGKDDIQLGVNESFYDTTLVVSSMVSCIFARVGKHSEIQQLAKYSKVPIINSLCDKFHPLQAICDILTIKEQFPSDKRLKVAWVGDANNVINDLAIAALKFGMDVSIATPKGIEIDAEIKDAAKEIVGRKNVNILYTHDPVQAVKEADVVVTDTFVSMGEEYMYKAKLQQFGKFQVNEDLCKHAAPNFKFMHCLPRHAEEVSDGIFYGPSSVVFEEAENRLYAAMAVIDIFVNKKGNFKLAD